MKERVHSTLIFVDTGEEAAAVVLQMLEEKGYQEIELVAFQHTVAAPLPGRFWTVECNAVAPPARKLRLGNQEGPR